MLGKDRRPNEKRFKKKQEYIKAKNLHIRSQEFLKKQVKSNKILMTTHQISEIFQVLGFRGLKIPLRNVERFCQKLIKSDFLSLYNISVEHINKALNLSIKSGIHIWDYLCIIPFYKEIAVIYSCDEHFNHESFKSLGPPIENPLNEWFLL